MTARGLVLVVVLVIMRSEVWGVFDLGVILQKFLVEEFAGERVPVADNVKPVDCSKNVAFLRPSKVLVS